MRLHTLHQGPIASTFVSVVRPFTRLAYKFDVSGLAALKRIKLLDRNYPPIRARAHTHTHCLMVWSVCIFAILTRLLCFAAPGLIRSQRNGRCNDLSRHDNKKVSLPNAYFSAWQIARCTLCTVESSLKSQISALHVMNILRC